MRMAIGSPADMVELLDQAFNQGDLETVLGFYEEAAAVVAAPDRIVRDPAELKSFLEGVMRSGVSAKQFKTSVIEADGIALFLSRWTLIPHDADPNADARTFVATTVLRRQLDGTWKVLIDNPIGPLLLGPE